MGIKDAARVSRPGMFEQIKDDQGNTYTPQSGSGARTNVSVNGSIQTVAIRTSNPDEARYKAQEAGLVKPEPWGF